MAAKKWPIAVPRTDEDRVCPRLSTRLLQGIDLSVDIQGMSAGHLLATRWLKLSRLLTKVDGGGEKALQLGALNPTFL
jgi:hypothetical protein